MQILPITYENASSASRIYALSWKMAYKNIVPQAYLDELSLERWTPFLESSIISSYALKVDEEYVATTSVFAARDSAMEGYGEIISIYVLPEHFFKGYGKKMLIFALEQLRNMGYDKVYLWVLEENVQARSFYERNGFTANGDELVVTIGGKDLIELRYVLNAD